MNNRVIDRDKGAKKLMQRLAQSGEITVGLHEAEGQRPKAGDDEGDEMLLIDVAIVHEFGSDDGHVPRRSFIRDWADERKAEHDDQMRRIAKAVIEGKMDAERALKRLGTLRQAEVQKRISDGISPPLEESTIKRKTVNGKKGHVPLIDTGQLRSSITHKVTVKR